MTARFLVVMMFNMFIILFVSKKERELTKVLGSIKAHGQLD